MSPRLIDVETEGGMEYWLSSEITDLFLTDKGEFQVTCDGDTGFIEANAYEVLCDEREDLIQGMLRNLPKKPNALIGWLQCNESEE
jgi:hypothetical protein